ncbi:OmpH family outer membrane protein [Sphingomonas hankyongi]|uniref:OmpH family outer membrane protein n=1 Tax=Sphingomonas hankyongi TaxID=2908209 RepID=A0ABT0S3R1_9SPHN|nr:OmpH family outer membrane protein [Sphingomonas hankyongi]MCL6730499.1 OmpH family outer membrane protein [Sphingomonas hankyongi]
MKKIILSAALVTATILPTAAQAQAIPAAVIAVVDLERVTGQCNACKTATAALRSQVSGLQAREKALSTPLETEGKAIQTAINALNGKEPDAALQARVRAFEQKRQQGAQEISRQQQQIQRNQQYIQQQIATKLGPIYQQVMQRRSATVLLETGSTLASSASIDVTNDVLAGLNTALPTIATTAPAQAQQTPPGR